MSNLWKNGTAETGRAATMKGKEKTETDTISRGRRAGAPLREQMCGAKDVKTEKKGAGRGIRVNQPTGQSGS